MQYRLEEEEGSLPAHSDDETTIHPESEIVWGPVFGTPANVYEII